MELPKNPQKKKTVIECLKGVLKDLLKYLTRKRLSNYLIQGFIALKGDSGL
jgi:hypothetical protein